MPRPGRERLLVVGGLTILVGLPSSVALGAGVAGLSPLGALGIGAVLVAALIATAVAGRGPLVAMASALPLPWEGAFSRRGAAVGWAALALVGIVQLTRLSFFMADPASTWGSTFPPVREGVTHACMSAYVHAADVQRRGDLNVYAEEHYPAFAGGTLGNAPPASSPVVNLAPWLEDPFEYPPPFLLLPRAALALTDDFLVMRAAWFVIRLGIVVSTVLAFAAALGGARGRVTVLLLPGLLASLPFMFDLQFGQFHLVTICLALLGMLGLHREGRGAQLAGAVLLGAAVVSKIFPALLLVPLLVRRRWGAVGATLAACALWSLLALAVLGPAPFQAFFQYHLPRIASGEAFSFFTRSDLTVAANWGIYGIPVKLARLGVPGMTLDVAAGLSWAYTLPLLLLAVRAGKRDDPSILWLALLCLASLRSPLAPNVYVGAPALLLLAACAVEVRGRTSLLALLAAWITIGGLPPLGSPETTIVAWMTGQLAMLALGCWVLLRHAPDAAGVPSQSPERGVLLDGTSGVS